MLRGARAIVGAVGTTLLLMLATLAAHPAEAGLGDWHDVSGGPAHPAPLHLTVPAYWSGATDQGARAFARLATGTPAADTVVLNGPNSAPPVPFDHATAVTIARLHRAGITVLGYVDTGYLGVTGHTTTRVHPGSTSRADWLAQIHGDIADWYRFYGEYRLDGVFLDQTLDTCGPDDDYLDAYDSVLTPLRRDHPEATAVLNPGTVADECYAWIADAVVMFEGSYATYRDWSPPDWVSRYPADRFWHLVYDTPTPEAMADVLTLARARHAGDVYVTDRGLSGVDSLWDGLPSYWDAEVRALG